MGTRKLKAGIANITCEWGHFAPAYLFGILFLFLPFPTEVMAQEVGEPPLSNPTRMSTVYKRYLEFPEPSGSVQARINPPVLRWPRETGSQGYYEVRLAQDPGFADPDKLLGTPATALAMFNPHQKLEEGSWYWQYRREGGNWSSTMRFEITADAVSIVSPPPTEFLEALPKSHPRVLATATGVSTLRRLKTNEDKQSILDEAEAALRSNVPEDVKKIVPLKGEDEEQDRKFRQAASKRLGDIAYENTLPLSEAFILTGEKRYADKAIQIALEVSDWDPEGESGFSDFGDARCMASMALVYDTFHDYLTAREQDRLRQAIKARTSRFYKSWVNNIEVRLLSGHVWQHILHYFFQTSLALYDDAPEAADWLAYAYEVFLARSPILGGMDGGWIEGASYFRMNMETLIDIPLYIKTYTGFDLMNEHPWYRNQIDWMIYHVPPGSAPDGFGDNTEEMDSPGSDYVVFALEMAKLTGNEKAAWYAKACQQFENINLSENRLLRWIRLTKTRDLPLPKPSHPPNLPKGRLFRDIGLVAMHTQPETRENNLMVAMRSSPFGSYGHMLSDQNVFNLLYGGKRLFYRTGYKISMNDPHRTGWYQHTKSQNGILVDGGGQPYSTEAFGWISRFLQGGGLVYAKGDATNAYQSAETGEDYGVVKNHRHLMLLEPDIVVIYDELEAEKEVEWSWLIHSLAEISLEPETGSFSTSLEEVKGRGQLWGSQSLTWHLTDTFDVRPVNWRQSVYEDGRLKTYDDDQWHLKAFNQEKTSKMRFLAVIQVLPSQLNSQRAIMPHPENGVVDIQIGNWKITAHVGSSLEPEIHILNKETSTVFSSHGEYFQTGQSVDADRQTGSSKLHYLQQGKPMILEANDELPYDMQSRFKHYQQPNP